MGLTLTNASSYSSNKPQEKSSMGMQGERAAALKQLDDLTSTGAYSKGKALVATLIEKYPNDPEVAITAARFYRKANAPQLAFGQYLKLVRLEPNLSEPYLALSQISLTNLETKQAVDYARKALVIDPNQEQANVALVNALIESDSLTEADHILSDLLKKSECSDNPTINYLAAKLNRKKGQMAFAMRFLDKAIDLKPDETDWLFDKATLCESLGDFAQTKAVLLKLLSLDPHSIEGLNKMAQVLEFYFHDFDGAIASYRKILTINPEYIEAETGIDRCAAKKNDLAGKIKNGLWQLLK